MFYRNRLQHQHRQYQPNAVDIESMMDMYYRNRHQHQHHFNLTLTLYKRTSSDQHHLYQLYTVDSCTISLAQWTLAPYKRTSTSSLSTFHSGHLYHRSRQHHHHHYQPHTVGHLYHRKEHQHQHCGYQVINLTQWTQWTLRSILLTHSSGSWQYCRLSVAAIPCEFCGTCWPDVGCHHL